MNILIALFTAVVLNPLIWLLLGLGLLTWRVTAGSRRARLAGIVLTFALWIICTRPFADLVIAPLELQYRTPSWDALQARDLRQVVVLTAGGLPVRDHLLSSGLPGASGARLMAGLEVCAHLRDCRLIFSGSAGRGREDRPTAALMEELARAYNPALQVVSESRSVDTAEHPVNVGPLVGRESFVLVTSAYHMPRAMLVFRRAGLSPEPFPVDRYAFAGYDVFSFIPSPSGLEVIQTALHEYVGLVWYGLTVEY